jgi:4-amino-4-deoxy-L-arabinose transferase-like glycosyltransferase
MMAPSGRWLRWTASWKAAFALALAVVVLARGVTIVDALRGPEPTATAFEEDAYYTFAVARNLAAGNGITAAHGEPTSGVQPLWTVLLVPAFAFFGDGRAVFTSIFLLSAVLWFAAARLFADLMTRHTASCEANLGGLAGPLCLIVFLCDPRLDRLFSNGLETGCYAVGLLWLWRWLDGGRALDARQGWRRCIAFGLFLGILLLARNDAVLIVPFALLAVILAYPDRRTLQRIVLVTAVAAAIFSPWLMYNYRLTGSIMPQSGLATIGDAIALDWLKVGAATRAVLELTAPPLVPGNPKIPSWCLAACTVILCAGFVRLYRRDAHAQRMARSSAWFAGGAVALVVYYLLFSRATWMYARYFMPVRLLALGAWTWLVLDTIARLRVWRASIVAAMLLTAVATSLVRAAHNLGSTPYTGDDLRLLISAGLCDGPARVGMFDSGRNAYRCAPYVINLDGKASLTALKAVADGRLLAHLAAFRIDRLYLRDVYVIWLDRMYPDWQQEFTLVSAAHGRAIFARVDPERDVGGRPAGAQQPVGQ